MSRSFIDADKSRLSYDYHNQVWIKDGKYTPCGHPPAMACNCFGRIHAGQAAVITEDCR